MSASRVRLFGWGFAAFMLVVPLLPFVPEFWVTLLILTGLASLVAIGLVVLTGMGGMTSFGQAAFVGFGGYTTGLLTTTYGWSPWLGLPAALLAAAIAALIVGGIVVRLAGHYLPLGTLILAISVYYIFGNNDALGGMSGIRNVPTLSIGDVSLAGTRAYWVVMWVALVLSIVATLNLLDSRLGRAFRALRRGAIAAEAFGVETARAKLVVFIYAAVLAGLSGWLYAHFQRSLTPSTFNAGVNIDYLLMAVVGGTGQVFGALLGAGIVTIVRDALQDLLGNFGSFEDVVFGVLLVVVLQYARGGLWPILTDRLPAPAPRLVDRNAEPLPPRARIARAPGSPLLEIDAVRKQFGGLVAVDDVTFTVGEGEIVALIGPNGAGKSTLFDVVTGVRKATAGTVRFAGESIQSRRPQAIAALGIGRTFQHVRLVNELSVIENVTLGAHLRGRAGPLSAIFRLDRREEARLFAEAARRIEHCGLADVMYKPAGSLSLGQMRVVEVARALCLDPRLVMLDEPAAGLRHLEKQALSKLLKELRDEGVSILIVEHDVEFVMGLAERVVVLDFGKKIAEGLPADIQTNPAVIEAYLGGVE